MSSTTNWFDLPLDLKINILSRIGHFQILENAQHVCSDWYKVCKDPSIWRFINLFRLRESFYSSEVSYGGLPGIWKICKICKNVVDRSNGQLVDIVIPDLFTDEVLMYVADRARQLKRLNMYCGIRDDSSIKTLHEALKKFPLLEKLSVDFEYLTKEAIESAGRYCPLLKTLSFFKEGELSSSLKVNDEIGVAIGENLHELRHLELINNTISNIGLKAILDGCHQLESLNLSMCAHIDLNGDVVKRCSEKIKHLTLPKPNIPKSVEYPDSDSDSDDDTEELEFIMQSDEDSEDEDDNEDSEDEDDEDEDDHEDDNEDSDV